MNTHLHHQFTFLSYCDKCLTDSRKEQNAQLERYSGRRKSVKRLLKLGEACFALLKSKLSELKVSYSCQVAHLPCRLQPASEASPAQEESRSVTPPPAARAPAKTACL